MQTRIKQVHCNSCNRTTSHDVAYCLDRPWAENIEDDYGETHSINGHDAFYTLVCRGCQTVTFQHYHWFSEDTDGTGRAVVYEDMFPPRISRPMPKPIQQLTANVLRHLNPETKEIGELIKRNIRGAS